MRWGILGCGFISNEFVNALKLVDDCQVVAVAASNLKRANDFAKLHGVETAFGSYNDLVEDPRVEIVYIGTLHTQHYEHTMLCLQRGKHVLVEKPMAMNSKQAKEMIDEAKRLNLFLLEGMWTRFFPATKKAKELIANGSIGDVVSVQSDFCIKMPKSTDRIWNKTLGGGGLLDLGIYPVAACVFAFDSAQAPSQIKAVGKVDGKTGVDLFESICIDYGDRGMANVSCSIVFNSSETTIIHGTKGRLILGPNAHCAETVQIHRDSGKFEEFSYPCPKRPSGGGKDTGFMNPAGLSYEAQAVQAAIRKGLTQCSEYSWDDSLMVMHVMDQTRQQIGLVYDQDNI